jgi:hypothetical protein
MMATETALLVADSLIGLDLPAAPQVIEPAVVFAASAEELRARLRRWERRFQNANAERTLKALRSDWQQFYGWCERAGCALSRFPRTTFCAFSTTWPRWDDVAQRSSGTSTPFVKYIKGRRLRIPPRTRIGR